MKNTFWNIIVAVLIMTCMSACQDAANLLDKEESNDIYEEMVFSDPYNAVWFLNGVYSKLNNGYTVFPSGNGFLGLVVDEGSWKATWDNSYMMSSGSWANNKVLLDEDPWKKNYTAIRAANRVLEHADEIPDSSEPFIDESVRNRMKGEAQFLRAMFYYELLKFYGGVPIIKSVLEASEENELKKERASFDETVEFICSEALAAAEKLPHQDEYHDAEWGRATKGACYALVSRVRLMAASPFFNDMTNPEGCEWRGQYNAEKWVDAAEAANDFLTKTRGYAFHTSTAPAMYGDYEDLYLRRSSPEIILAYQQGVNAFKVEYYSYPGRFFNTAKPFSMLNNMPTLNTVAEYEYLDIDAEGNIKGSHLIGIDKLLELYESGGKGPGGFDPQNPYVNRDPRFYQSVWYNGEPHPAKEDGKGPMIFDLYHGGQDDPSTGSFYATGFLNRKFVDAQHAMTSSGSYKGNHNWIIFRYAEILLNYAEAVNEAYGPDAVPAGFTMSARDALNKVRERVKFPAYELPDNKWPVGMPKNVKGSLPPVPAGLTTEQFRERVVHERRVEFLYEEHRYFDLNRWKQRSGMTVYAQIIDKDETTGALTYSAEPLMTKTWFDKFYLFPILVDEIEKSPKLKQNPGWDNVAE